MGRDLLRFRSLSRALIGLGAFTLLTLPLLAPADTRTVLVDSDNPNTTPSVTVHARPAMNGVALGKADGDQILPVIASDGSGGALVAWQDSWSGLSDIYAQHLLSSGIVDPDWPGDGLLVCDAANNQRQPKITADGAHGV